MTLGLSCEYPTPKQKINKHRSISTRAWETFSHSGSLGQAAADAPVASTSKLSPPEENVPLSPSLFHHTLTNVPTSPELQSTFALGSEIDVDWQQFLIPDLIDTRSSSSSSAETSIPSDQQLVEHFLFSMARKAQDRDRHTVDYASAIYRQAVHNPTLFGTLLALSAMHLTRAAQGSSGRNENFASTLPSEAWNRYLLYGPTPIGTEDGARQSGRDLEWLIATSLATCEYEISSATSHAKLQSQIDLACKVFERMPSMFVRCADRGINDDLPRASLFL